MREDRESERGSEGERDCERERVCVCMCVGACVARCRRVLTCILLELRMLVTCRTCSHQRVLVCLLVRLPKRMA